ncbi:hypothetical protein ABW19_dt0205265 [Dactylella cylindrospora]|nr:hypothetical protein ABW19_dt0205265 [Dactylella cylindrospora]
MSASMTFKAQPPKTSENVLVSFPSKHILLVTMNREKQMNALSSDVVWEMDAVWRWFDAEPELRVGIVTGAGQKAFCAGMDLKERLSKPFEETLRTTSFPSTGFAGLSRRLGRKPIIAAVNGHAHGGGLEIAANCDLVVAAENATFRLPDVARGTAAISGCLPRLARTLGLQRAMQLALTAYTLPATEAKEWGLVMKVVHQDKLIDEAVALASLIASMSPDSVVVSRSGIRQAWETASVNQAADITSDRYAIPLMTGDNVKAGLQAFLQKRDPVWVPSKL